MPNNIIKNPIIEHNLSIIRNKNTDSISFRNAIFLLAKILSSNAINNLPLKEIEIQTPVAKTKTKVIDASIEIFVAPVLRAGLAISEALLDFLPFYKVQHLGMYRNEETLEPVWYYNKLPKNFSKPENTYVYICDPMLATGGSSFESIKLYVEKGVPEGNITLINIISAPEGVEKILNNFPKVNIYTTAVDEKLNEKGYIIPGLGDAGDRFFNTFY